MKCSGEDAGRIIELRRDLHRRPELSFKEFKTQRRILDELKETGLTPAPIADTGVVADLALGDGKGRSILLRADMDALPLQEERTEHNEDYISRVPGVMHGCGHDGHMAMVLGAARLLTRNKRTMEESGVNGTVRFLFQPAEELPPGGALRVIDGGGLVMGGGANAERMVDATVAFHLFGSRPAGTVFFRPGPIMASVDTFRVNLHGRGGHGAQPHMAVDPVYMAARFVTDVQSVVSRRVDPLHPAVITVGKIEGGTRDNIIPEKVYLEGTVRTLEEGERGMLEGGIRAVLDGVIAGQGGPPEEGAGERDVRAPSYDMEYERGYPATVNDPDLSRWLAGVLADSAREWNAGPSAEGSGIRAEVIPDCDPYMVAEDFSYYAREVPSAFLFLGCADGARGITAFNHNPRFDIDERVLPLGAGLLADIARRRLRGE